MGNFFLHFAISRASSAKIIVFFPIDKILVLSTCLHGGDNSNISKVSFIIRDVLFLGQPSYACRFLIVDKSLITRSV